MARFTKALLLEKISRERQQRSQLRRRMLTLRFVLRSPRSTLQTVSNTFFCLSSHHFFVLLSNRTFLSNTHFSHKLCMLSIFVVLLQFYASGRQIFPPQRHTSTTCEDRENNTIRRRLRGCVRNETFDESTTGSMGIHYDNVAFNSMRLLCDV